MRPLNTRLPDLRLLGKTRRVRSSVGLLDRVLWGRCSTLKASSSDRSLFDQLSRIFAGAVLVDLGGSLACDPVDDVSVLASVDPEQQVSGPRSLDLLRRRRVHCDIGGTVDHLVVGVIVVCPAVDTQDLLASVIETRWLCILLEIYGALPSKLLSNIAAIA